MDSKKQFEAWAKNEGLPITKNSKTKNYSYRDTYLAFKGYELGLASQQAKIEELTKENERLRASHEHH